MSTESCNILGYTSCTLSISKYEKAMVGGKRNKFKENFLTLKFIFFYNKVQDCYTCCEIYKELFVACRLLTSKINVCIECIINQTGDSC